MNYVFVLDTNKQPLNPVHPGWARKLLSSGRAAVYRRYPFTIILKCAVPEPALQGLRLKIDPGSKTTGLAIINDDTGDVVFAAELQHRGQQTSLRGTKQSRSHWIAEGQFAEVEGIERQGTVSHVSITADAKRGAMQRSRTPPAPKDGCHHH